MPFVEHVAYMGIENCGYAKQNEDLTWIEPFYYIDSLSESIELLTINGFKSSIYNLQLCLLPEHLRCFSRRSISDWKNHYLDICRFCTISEDCCGLFTTSEGHHS